MTVTTLPLETVSILAPALDRRIGRRESIPRWSLTSRLALGAWTFSMPLMASALALWALASGDDTEPALFAVATGFFVAHAIIAMLYVAFAAQNPRIERERTAWMLSIALAGPVAIPAYWIIHVLNAPTLGRPDVDEETALGLVEARKPIARRRGFGPATMPA